MVVVVVVVVMRLKGIIDYDDVLVIGFLVLKFVNKLFMVMLIVFMEV